ncbi:ribosomal RNA-processing protein 7 like protein [Favolaschia claudopus]|uniref:Ribosomal RNA-processing protein 7 like protein n=1 Tax=Favolaschia claudopus TaxID=2862362 RepID=A0AAW0CUB7_9AGAR
MSLPSSVAGFTVLPISYPGSSNTSTHYIYARAHTGSKKANTSKTTLPDSRTLFLVNVPPDATDRELVLLFKSSGTVERVVFDLDADGKEGVGGQDDEEEDDEGSELSDDADANTANAEEERDADMQQQPRKRRKLDKKPKPPQVTPLPTKPLRALRPTGRTAHLVFLDASSLERALAPQKKNRVWPSSSSTSTSTSESVEKELSGLARYTALYDSLRPPLDSVRAHADSAMEVFEYELAQTRREAGRYKKGEAIVDEDGFTLVTRGGVYGQTVGGGVGVASKVFQAEMAEGGKGKNKKGRRGREGKEKEGFYAFQKAERQRNDLLELKKNWEADKAKIEKLKASRKFKPY